MDPLVPRTVWGAVSTGGFNAIQAPKVFQIIMGCASSPAGELQQGNKETGGFLTRTGSEPALIS